MHERGKLIRTERSSSEKQENEWVYGERHPIKMRRSRVAKRGISNMINYIFAGGDALRGHTRSHPEHDG